MREKIIAILFIILLAFIAVFSFDIFNKLFIAVDNKFAETASAAFLGAFLAFTFVRVGDFVKAFADRTAKHYNTLIRLQLTLNSLLGQLDDNIYIIETFETIYTDHIKIKRIQ